MGRGIITRSVHARRGGERGAGGTAGGWPVLVAVRRGSGAGPAQGEPESVWLTERASELDRSKKSAKSLQFEREPPCNWPVDATVSQLAPDKQLSWGNLRRNLLLGALAVITATSLFQISRKRPQFTATKGEKSTTGARQRTNKGTSGAKTGRSHGVVVPLGFLFPVGSSTSVHVAPHTY